MNAPAWAERAVVRRVVVTLTLLLALMPVVALAAEVVSDVDVTITSPVNDDLYAFGWHVFGGEVVINADVDGDVVAIATTVEITGNVHGSVYAIATQVEILGNVDGSVIAVGTQVLLNGDIAGTVRLATLTRADVRDARIGGDLVVAGGALLVDAASSIGGDLLLRSGSARVDSDVAGCVEGRVDDDLRLGGRVGGPIDVRADTLRFADGADVAQPVIYTSDHEALIDDGATVSGTLTRIEPSHPTIGDRLVDTLAWAVVRYLWALSLGMVLLRVAPGLLLGVSTAMRRKLLPSIGWGLLALLGVPLLVVSLLLFALPVALLLAVVFLFAIYASQLALALVIGHAVARPSWRSGTRYRDGVKILALGLAIVVLARAVPVPGWAGFSGFLIALTALGALVVHLFRRSTVSLPAPQR